MQSFHRCCLLHLTTQVNLNYFIWPRIWGYVTPKPLQSSQWDYLIQRYTSKIFQWPLPCSQCQILQAMLTWLHAGQSDVWCYIHVQASDLERGRNGRRTLYCISSIWTAKLCHYLKQHMNNPSNIDRTWQNLTEQNRRTEGKRGEETKLELQSYILTL